MNYRFNLLSWLLIALAVTAGCRSTPPERFTTPEPLYDLAKKALDKGDYAEAIRNYEMLEARFPFSNVARQGHLDLMYAYYKNDAAESAIDQAEQFIRENPTHPRVDYAYYIKGLANFERDRNFLERWFRVDLSKRPPSNARSSFQSFQQLLQRFPESQYAADTRQRMIALRNRLADYELHVARYYVKRGAYVGALNRSKYVLENYDGAPAVKESLQIMEDSYKRLGMDDLATNTQKVLKENFPDAKSAG